MKACWNRVGALRACRWRRARSVRPLLERLLRAICMCLAFGAVQVYGWDYGNGRHGSFVLTTNATIEQLYQTVRLTNDPAQYNPADSNAVPNFHNLTVTNGATLTANAWNGALGGWIVLKVMGTLSIAADSAISASGIGYRGGGYTTQGGIFLWDSGRVVHWQPGGRYEREWWRRRRWGG